MKLSPLSCSEAQLLILLKAAFGEAKLRKLKRWAQS